MRSMEELEKLFDGKYHLCIIAEYLKRYPDVLFFASCAGGSWNEMTVLEIITFAEHLKNNYVTKV